MANLFDSVTILKESKNCTRTGLLLDFFQCKFNTKPDFFVSVPGRVNLIGEHIDYCGYGVCPMAIQFTTILAVKKINNDLINLVNIDKNYEDYNCNINEIKIELEKFGSKWYYYFLCGVLGILELEENMSVTGLQVAVSGNIPSCAGLSSSSALVSASVLACAYAFKLNSLNKQKLADISAKCERYIGTQGGGMDQAIAFLATKGCAKYIKFSPLRSKDVKLPKNAKFVLIHSMAELNKSSTSHFNQRVMECKFSAYVLSKLNNLNWRSIKNLQELEKKLKFNLEEMIKQCETHLHDEPYTKKEICEILEIDENTLSNLLSNNTKDMNSFQLKKRALHVYQEANRVEKFFNLCQKNLEKDDEILKSLGELMTASHISLRDQYECSHPNLDKIVELSKSVSFGARLTGAGWGGYVVALVKESFADEYIDIIKRNFFAELNIEKKLTDTVIFSTSPSRGAYIYSIA